MADLIFVAVTVAFFLLATGYVTLCNRIVGSDALGSTHALSQEIPMRDAGAPDDIDMTEQKGVRAQ